MTDNTNPSINDHIVRALIDDRRRDRRWRIIRFFISEKTSCHPLKK